MSTACRLRNETEQTSRVSLLGLNRDTCPVHARSVDRSRRTSDGPAAVPIGCFRRMGPGIPNRAAGPDGQLASGCSRRHWHSTARRTITAVPHQGWQRRYRAVATVGPDGVVHIRANDAHGRDGHRCRGAEPNIGQCYVRFRPAGAHITAPSAFDDHVRPALALRQRRRAVL
jgi:hypothetical protein